MEINNGHVMAIEFTWDPQATVKRIEEKFRLLEEQGYTVTAVNNLSTCEGRMVTYIYYK